MASQIIGTSTICSLKCIKAPRYWPFVRGIHRSPLDSSNKGSFHVFMKSIMGYFFHWNDRLKCWHGERWLLWIHLSLYNTLWPGARPINEFRIRYNFKVLRCKMCSTNYNEIWHTSRKCNCRYVCQFLLRYVWYIINQITANFGRTSYSIEIPSVAHTCVAPVNVVTYHKCINGKKLIHLW